MAGNIAGAVPDRRRYYWNHPGFKSATINSIVGTSVSFVKYATDLPNADSLGGVINNLKLKVAETPNRVLKGSSFKIGTREYQQYTDNTLVSGIDATTGTGTPSGSVNPALSEISISVWDEGASAALQNWRGLLVPPSEGVEAPYTATNVVFRTAAAPLRPGSVSVLGTLQDGTTFNLQVGNDGIINGTRVKGKVDFEYGLVNLFFVNPDGDVNNTWDFTGYGIPGTTVVPKDLARLDTLRYNAVSYSYLPLDADLLGIDPVRLPSDGRVPIFRPGGFAVVGHTGEITATVSNGQTINCARVRLSRVRVLGADGAVINTGYMTDLEAGTVTFNDVTGYSQPVTIQHRIEDMGVVRQVDINGEISLTRPLTHEYPLGSYISSALIAGDLFARTSLVFDLASWNGVFSDTPGTAATATFNQAQFPITVTNRGAITERWAVQFTNTTSFNVIGENVGVIATGNTSTDCAPINPATGAPYFTIPAAGWGSGWATGNVLRFNTVGAMFPVWLVRTVQQGPETVLDDNFTVLIRGDVNANP